MAPFHRRSDATALADPPQFPLSSDPVQSQSCSFGWKLILIGREFNNKLSLAFLGWKTGKGPHQTKGKVSFGKKQSQKAPCKYSGWRTLSA